MLPRLRRELGSYMPAFYTMNLSFSFPSGTLAHERLDERNLSIFTHEYIHFMQDLSTYAGLNNAYVYSECVHGLVTNMYKKPKGHFEIPVAIPDNYCNIELNKLVNSVSMGTISEIDEFFLTHIKKSYTRVPYSNPFVKQLTNIELIPAKGEKVVFGSRAIMESMAYHMETIISKGSLAAQDYPYHAAEIVVDKIFPEFGQDKLRIIALCDMSLQFSEAGKIFVHTLQTFKQDNFLPDNANEIVDYFYSTPCIQMGEHRKMEYGLLNMGLMVGERMKLYLNDKRFNAFHNVIHTLIGFGMKERLNNRYFMLDIVRNGYILDNPLMRRYIRMIGTPIIVDSNEDYWIVPPVGWSTENYRIEYFPAIEQVYKCLGKGQDICEMYNWCEKSEKTQEDERCISEPWTRCRDLYLCPYAMLWKHWNLSDYIPCKREDL